MFRVWCSWLIRRTSPPRWVLTRCSGVWLTIWMLSLIHIFTVRTAIDGVPIDMFVAAAEDGENNYVGQYNFNNEKSKSGDPLGLSGVEG